MEDLLLKFDFIDRAERNVYNVFKRSECEVCDALHWVSTGQQIRFDMDGEFRLKAMIDFYPYKN